MLEVLPLVLFTDLAWLAVVGSLACLAPTKLTRRLAWAMVGYVATEALLHVYLERGAAMVLGRL